MQNDHNQEKKRGPGDRLTVDLKNKLVTIIGEKSQLDGGFEGDKGKIRIQMIAEKLSIDERTVERYIKKQEIAFVKPNAAEKFINYQKAVYIEGLRLISTPVTNITSYMKQYLPNLTIPALKNVRKDQGIEKKPLGSERTYYDRALKCFCTDNIHETVRSLRSDESLNSRVKNSLKRWPPGTIGIHAVTVDYQLTHPNPLAPRNRGSRIFLMLMIVRTNHKDKDLAFSVLTLNCKDSEKISDIKEYLKSLPIQVTSIRLVTKMENGKVIPTAVGKETLQEAIGSEISIELDEPTQGERDSFRILNKRFSSKKAVNKYLCKLYINGYH